MPEVEYKTENGQYGLTSNGGIWDYDGNCYIVKDLVMNARKSISLGAWAGHI